MNPRSGLLGLVALTLALAGCGGETPTTPAPQTQASSAATTQRQTTTATPPSRSQTSAREDRKRQTTTAPHHRHRPKSPVIPPGVGSTLHAYIGALNAHDGQALCALFAPGALDALPLPEGSGCSGLSASIGHAGPHGLPVWASAQLQRIESIVTESGGVRATVRIVDRYRDNPQPSFEDDVIFLARSGTTWLLQKPSITTYRAIGTQDPPPTVLAAP